VCSRKEQNPTKKLQKETMEIAIYRFSWFLILGVLIEKTGGLL
jgi:hypothetical protein